MIKFEKFWANALTLVCFNPICACFAVCTRITGYSGVNVGVNLNGAFKAMDILVIRLSKLDIKYFSIGNIELSRFSSSISGASFACQSFRFGTVFPSSAHL